MRLAAVLIALLAATPALADDDPLARIAALEDARHLGNGALAALASDQRAPVRLAAVRALGRIGDADGGAAVVKALEDADPAVRREAAFALGLLGDVAPLVKRHPAETDAAVRVAIVEAVGRAGKVGVVPFLVARASHGPLAERRAALVGLGLVAKRNDGALPGVDAAQIDAWLKAPEVEVRFGASYALLRAKALAGDAALATARRCAGDADEEVRVHCVRALARFPAAVDALATAAKDASWRVRAEAAKGLGDQKAGDALAALLRAPASFDGTDLHPLVAALDAALALPPTPALTEAAEGLHAATAPTKEFSLGRGHLHCRAAALLDRATGKVARVPKCGGKAYPRALRDALTVQVLEVLPPAARARALAAFFAKATPQGQASAVGALKDLGGEKAAQRLVPKALASRDPAVVAEAATVAGEWGDQSAAGPLLDAAHRLVPKGEYEAAQSVFEALGKLKSKAAVPLLQGHVFHENAALRKAALDALNAIGDAGAYVAEAPPVPPPAPSLTVPSPFRAATVRTTRGAFTIELFAEDAPNTVKNFAALAARGFYDGLTFHRVVPDFVVQGGDPRGDGWGGPGYTIRCEINPHPYERGAVGMALAGKDTGGSQFFVTHGPQPHLDGGYTVFGRVREGMDVVDTLTVGDRILKIELSRGL
jgi:cyclophilin family peptidyl-prolyl cis-trans isomerase